MDSVNLSESQSTQLNFRSAASNTTPSRCPCGSFNEHAQAFPQAYCFRPSNLGQSQCKHSQNAEEKFPMQQHFYPSLPFVSPFFYNGSLTNLHCPHNFAPETPAKEQQKQPANEPGNVFYEKEKSFRTTDEVDAQKNNAFGSEAQFFGHPCCFPNAQDPVLGTGFQRCGCGDSLPWTCGSLIVPMISYCVISNSRKSNLNIPTGNSPEASQQNKATGSQSDTSTDISPANQTKDFNNNSTENCDDGLEVDGVINIEWGNEERAEDIDHGTTKSFKSLASSFENESVSDNAEENSEKNERNLEVGSDDSEEASGEDQEEDEEGQEDGETHDWADEDKNGEDETAVSNVYFSNESQCYIKEIESQPPSASESYTDVKKLEKNKAPVSGVGLKVNPPDSMAEGEKAFRSRMTNPNVREKFGRQKTHPRKAVCIKKFINNFTMTDQTNRVHEEAQTSAAAAGDLGGVNCVGYKINVSGCFDGRQLEILEGTQTVENAKTKEIHVKDLSHSEQGNNSPKITEKNTKTVRHFRSGIAKLLNTPKLKDTKGEPVKNTKEPVQRKPTGEKRKHSCFPTDTTVGTSSKFQKTKNYRLTQVPEKQQKTKSSNSETPRKGEKIQK